MKNLQSIDDLFLHNLRDIYHAEKQLARGLPKLAKQLSAPELKEAFERHLKETEGQIKRLEKIFGELDLKPSAEKCEGMAGIVKEAEELLSKNASPELMDLGLLLAAQKVEHYEMAGYEGLITCAEMTGQREAEKLLRENLREEEAQEEKLKRLIQKESRQKKAA